MRRHQKTLLSVLTLLASVLVPDVAPAGPAHDAPLLTIGLTVAGGAGAPATNWRDELADPGEEAVIASLAAADRIEYLTDLDMIAAHLVAGRAAYLAGDRAHGAEMFAHAIAELYVDLMPALEKLGARDFLAELQSTVDAAVALEPGEQVAGHVRRALTEIERARIFAPVQSRSAPDAGYAVFHDLVVRAAAEYRASFTATTEREDDSYMDGFGFFQLAKMRSAAAMSTLARKNHGALGAAGDVMAMLSAAYPSIERPAMPAVPPASLLAAASRMSPAALVR